MRKSTASSTLNTAIFAPMAIGEHRDGDEREALRGPERAKAVSQVADELVVPAQPTRVTRRFLVALDGAELEARAPGGIGGGESRADPMIGTRLQMEVHLVGQIALDARAADRATDKRTQAGPHG